jgi:hypothetical protein
LIFARLHPPKTPSSDRYSVEFHNEIIVVSSRTAEMDAARVLLKRGITGPLTFLCPTGKPRLIIDIAKAARLSIDDRHGMRFARWRPFLPMPYAPGRPKPRPKVQPPQPSVSRPYAGAGRSYTARSSAAAENSQ